MKPGLAPVALVAVLFACAPASSPSVVVLPVAPPAEPSSQRVEAVEKSAPSGEQLRECNELVTVINAGVRALEAPPRAGADASGERDARELAILMEKVAADCAAVNLTIDELRRLRRDYKVMAADTARAARAFADAVEAKDAAKLTAAQAAMQTAVKREDPLVERINQFCQGT